MTVTAKNTERQGCSRYFLLSADFSADRVAKQRKARREKGKEHEEKADQKKNDPREPFTAKGHGVPLEQSRFKKKDQGGRQKKDQDIKPIRCFPERAVCGIEQNGNEDKPRHRSRKLDPSKALFFAKSDRFRHGEEKKREKEQLHVLPGGFVHARDQGADGALARQVVQKMKECSPDAREGKSAKLPQPQILLFHTDSSVFFRSYASARGMIPKKCFREKTEPLLIANRGLHSQAILVIMSTETTEVL